MRTTLELDDTVLAAARTLSRAAGISLGAAVSELARRGLRAGPADSTRRVRHTAYSPFPVVVGVAEAVTDQLVLQHRDD